MILTLCWLQVSKRKITKQKKLKKQANKKFLTLVFRIIIVGQSDSV